MTPGAASLKAAYVYSPEMAAYEAEPGHPADPSRLRLAHALLQGYGAFALPGSRLVDPRPATEAELLTFHTPEYVAAVKALSQGDADIDPVRFNLGPGTDNPVFPDMFPLGLLAVGATLTAAELVASGQAAAAFSPAGGLHHGRPNEAYGFCLFNDVVIAILALRQRGLRVAYVDIDAHHADGVQDAFYQDSQVLTISLHESGQSLFPGTGEVDEIGSGPGQGYNVNLPLAPGTGDGPYLRAFRQIALPLLKGFKPQILVAQLGADCHYLDRVAHLSLTTRGYAQVAQELAAFKAPLVALGGGGYNIEAAARCWALAYGAMMGVEWPDQLPDSLQDSFSGEGLRDRGQPYRERDARQRIYHYTESTVIQARRQVFPFHGLEASRP
ncbi:MAG: acetoin utilization protein AcuC [Chloroflexi bacterium]|nr:acetoin utilization protein AcuC [Chloroflexota bacterium]